MERFPHRAARAVAVLAAAGVAAVGAAAPAQADHTLRHAAGGALHVGTAVTPDWLSNPTYAGIAGSEFSSITAENHMKWETLQPSPGNFNFGPGDQIVAFAEQNNQQVYGHTLVWHSQAPQWVQDLSGPALDQAMEQHITTVLQHYAGSVAVWDVVNEVIDDNAQLRDSFWLQELGPDYIADAFHYARAADPQATLCLNDYSIDGINAKSDAYFNLVQQLLTDGVPVDCMSFQGHLILGQVPPTMQQNLQRFADLGLQVWVTELDIRMNVPPSSQQLQQQASEYAQVFEVCQNVTNCAGVTTWGVHDAQSWIPDVFPGEGAALMWDDNFQPKPAYFAVLDQLGGGGGGPGTPPSPPTGLATTGSTSSSISLSWNGSAGASSYLVLRAPGASGGSFTQVGSTSGTSFTDTGLPADSTFRYQVTAANAAGSSAPSNTVTASTGPGGGGPGGGCEVTYQANNWGGHPGFTADVTVTNTSGSALSSWTLQWSYPAGQSVEEPGWNATVTQTGATVTAVNAPWNGELAPGQSTSFGFNGEATAIGNNPPPTDFTLNGTSCTLG